MDRLRDRVADALRERILSNDWPPGTKLRERAISVELGVSRVPVREAIMVLAGDLLVDVAPGSGAVVSSFGYREVAELFDAREALEPLVARLAALHRDDGQLDRLTRSVAASNRAASAGDHRGGAVANADFHEGLVAASGSDLLVAIMSPLQVRIERLFRRTIAGRAVELAEDHQRILDAVSRGDEDAAALLAQLHVSTTRSPSLALFAEQDA